MASKRTTFIYPNGGLTISEAPFANDREAYYDLQKQDERARSDVILSKEVVDKTVVIVENTGVVIVLTYTFDAENYWEA